MSLGRHGGGPWRPWGHRSGGWGRWGPGWNPGWSGGGYWPAPPVVVVESSPAYVARQRLIARDPREVPTCPGLTSMGRGIDRCGNGDVIYDRTRFEEVNGKLVRRTRVVNGLLGLLG